MMPEEESGEETEVESKATAEIPLSFFGENAPKEGDRVSLEVEGVDAESGTVTVCMESEDKETESEAKGIEALAAKFD